MSKTEFTAREKAGLREAYREFKESRPGLVDGMNAVKSFMDSGYCQWGGSVEELYLVVIGRQGD
jgi:hypothetical protein